MAKNFLDESENEQAVLGLPATVAPHHDGGYLFCAKIIRGLYHNKSKMRFCWGLRKSYSIFGAEEAYFARFIGYGDISFYKYGARTGTCESFQRSKLGVYLTRTRGEDDFMDKMKVDVITWFIGENKIGAGECTRNMAGYNHPHIKLSGFFITSTACIVKYPLFIILPMK